MVEKGCVAVGKILYLSAPVVHLGVDVDGVFSAPGRPHILVPYALQVKGKCSRTGACYHKIAGEIEVEGNKLVVLCVVFLNGVKAFIGGA